MIISSGCLGSDEGKHYETHCGRLIKLLWHDGIGLCLLSKRLERGHFIWPQSGAGAITLSQAQLATLLEGCEWRAPAPSWRPELAG